MKKYAVLLLFFPALAHADTLAEWRAKFLVAINQFRSEAHTCGDTAYPAARPVTYDEKLNKVALWFATDLRNSRRQVHMDSRGEDPHQRGVNIGYTGCLCSENVAVINPDRPGESVDNVIYDWSQHPGHCKNLMGADFDQIGFGVAIGPTLPQAGDSDGEYIVVDFGRSDQS